VSLKSSRARATARGVPPRRGSGPFWGPTQDRSLPRAKSKGPGLYYAAPPALIEEEAKSKKRGAHSNRRGEINSLSQFRVSLRRAVAKATENLEESGEKFAPVGAAAIRKLASKITGRVITPDKSDYESACQVNNQAYHRRPAVIVRCASPADVARALDFGQSNRLTVVVRCGGHSAAGFGVCNGGVVIDVAGMKRVEVDVHKRTARAEAGALIGDVDRATQRFGLATVMGGCPTVGIGGLTLGGGIGSLTPKYGAACDNVKSAEVVTVDSRQIEASHKSNSDLIWAIRGGGGNFGVVTSFQYRLHPVTDVLAGALEYPAGRIPELLRMYLKFTATAPDEVMLVSR
jgi:FAD binding domain